MKRVLLAAAFAIAATPAFAEVPVDFDWSGIHVGILASGDVLSQQAPDEDGYYYGDYYGSSTASKLGGGLGIDIGANAQYGHVVLGADLDANWLTGKVTHGGDIYDLDSYFDGKWKDYITLRAKAGLAIDRGLIYVTGGLAFVNAEYRVCYYDGCSPSASYDYGSKPSQFGFTGGVGFEYALTDSLTINGEYLYVGVASKTATAPYDLSDEEIYKATFTSSANFVRVGLNWYVH
jgi:outer membrane immunogenic protein